MTRRASDATNVDSGSLSVLAALSFVVGAVSGSVVALFRLALEQADALRNSVISWARESGLGGLALAAASGAFLTAASAWLVRRYSPHASGSGIPHVEAVLNEEIPQAPVRLIPVKFVGGVLAMGSGLALGREGPSVHMGASLAHWLAKSFRRNEPDCLVLLAAGAGAGLATAFNAPIAGAIFVLEELVRRFDTRITIATFGASAGAIAVSRLFTNQASEFALPALAPLHVGTVPISLVLGVLAGVLGAAYNRALLRTLDVTELRGRWRAELRAALIGAAVGILAWFAPDLVGGGDSITQRTLVGSETAKVLVTVFVVRFALGVGSYAARTPGGLFAPMLALGALGGQLFGKACSLWFPTIVPSAPAMAVVGMAAFFTAVVRAPLTGIVLVTEMTGSFTMLFPMLAASFAAMLTTTLLNSPPIYDSLRDRVLEAAALGGGRTGLADRRTIARTNRE